VERHWCPFLNFGLELKDDGSVFLHNLKILWDKLELTIAVDIPEICVGGFCLIPNPFDGCLVEAPKLCIFGGHPDFTFTLAIDQFVTSEISVEGSIVPLRRRHYDPRRACADGLGRWDPPATHLRMIPRMYFRIQTWMEMTTASASGVWWIG